MGEILQVLIVFLRSRGDVIRESRDEPDIIREIELSGVIGVSGGRKKDALVEKLPFLSVNEVVVDFLSYKSNLRRLLRIGDRVYTVRVHTVKCGLDDLQ